MKTTNLLVTMAVLAVVWTSSPNALAQSASVPAWLSNILPGSNVQQGTPLAMLNLDQDQMRKMAEISEKRKQVNAETMQKLAQIYSQMPALIAAEKLNEEAINDAYTALFDLQRQSIMQGVRAYNAQIAVLTEQQHAQWNQMRAHYMKKAGMTR